MHCFQIIMNSLWYSEVGIVAESAIKCLLYFLKLYIFIYDKYYTCISGREILQKSLKPPNVSEMIFNT